MNPLFIHQSTKKEAPLVNPEQNQAKEGKAQDQRAEEQGAGSREQGAGSREQKLST